jgi:hypothetical protein
MKKRKLSWARKWRERERERERKREKERERERERVLPSLLFCSTLFTYVLLKKKRKDSAGSDDTASMIKGGGYLGARTRLITYVLCHAQSLAATNRVTEQINWLTVESFFMSCSISWMASLIMSIIRF